MERIRYAQFSYVADVENGWRPVESTENVTFPAVKLGHI